MFCSVYKDGVSFACCSACTKQYGFCFSVCDNPATYCEKMAVHKYCLCWTHQNRWTALKVNSRGDSGLFYVRLIFDQQMAPWTCFTNRTLSINYPFSDVFLMNGVLRAYIRTTPTSFFLKKTLNIRSSCEYFRIFEGKAVGGNVWPHISACETCCLSGVEMGYSQASVENIWNPEICHVFLEWIKIAIKLLWEQLLSFLMNSETANQIHLKTS